MKKIFIFIIIISSGNTCVAQNVGIGTITPKARLHVVDSSVVFSAADPLLSLPGNAPVSGAGARMMWYPGKASFRSGFIDGAQWDKDNVGHFSFASGYNTQANNLYTTALGRNTTASGTSASALGYYTIASGSNSSAFGAYNQATGNEATAMGNNTLSSGFAATSMGFATIAKGDYSVALGSYTKSKSPSSTVIGLYNDTINTNRLFEIGNGIADNARANALTVLTNGNTGLGTTSPQARLHVSDSAVLFTGPGIPPVSTAYGPPASGAGTRLMWYPQKAAFRVGIVLFSNWDKDSVGLYSFASGYNTKAKGTGATSLGVETTASGTNSTSMGGGTKATNSYSTSMGANTEAIGFISTSMGNGTRASGDNSTTMGMGTLASGFASTATGYETEAIGGSSTSIGLRAKAMGHQSFAAGGNTFAKAVSSFTIGTYNDNTDIPDTYIEAGTDRVFQIGNGTFDARSNALTILRNGKTGIGIINPTKQLEVVGPASAIPVTLVIGNRGGFGPVALEFVSDYGSASQWRPGYMRSNDLGGFTGSLEFYTNGTGPGSLYGNIKGFEVRNGAALTATGAVGSYSDARLKNNISAFTDGLNVIRKINPVQFYYNDDAPFKTSQQQIGIIAQELEKTAPYMVEKNAENGYSDLRTVNNQAYIFLLINAVKEQDKKITEQNKKMEEQQKQIDEQGKMIEQLLKK